jgi:hypothetical protein
MERGRGEAKINNKVNRIMKYSNPAIYCKKELFTAILIIRG